MTPEELAAIRERDAALDRHQEHRRNTGLGEMRPLTGDLDRRALLAHIDAITEAVATMDPDEREGLPPSGWFFDGFYEARDKAEALLRGER